jgi:hypothetical protein
MIKKKTSIINRGLLLWLYVGKAISHRSITGSDRQFTAGAGGRKPAAIKEVIGEEASSDPYMRFYVL